jgi:hypothetical protein
LIYYDSTKDQWREVVARCGLRYELIYHRNGVQMANIYDKDDKLVGESIDLIRGFAWLRENGYAQPRKVALRRK